MQIRFVLHFGQEKGSQLIIHDDVKERLIEDARRRGGLARIVAAGRKERATSTDRNRPLQDTERGAIGLILNACALDTKVVL